MEGGTLVGVRAGEQIHTAATVVVAAGVDSPAICAGAGIAVPARSSPAIMVRLRAEPGLISHIVANGDFEVRQLPDGTLLMPIDYEGQTSQCALEATAEQTRRRLLRSLTVTAAVELLRVDVGWRPIPAGGQPIVGPIESVPGLYVCVVHPGIVLAPTAVGSLPRNYRRESLLLPCGGSGSVDLPTFDGRHACAEPLTDATFGVDWQMASGPTGFRSDQDNKVRGVVNTESTRGIVDRFRVRPMVRSDWRWISDWFRDAELDRRLGPVDEEWLEHVLSDRDGVQLVLEDDERPVALVGCVWDRSGVEHGITDLAVNPQLRHSGIGREAVTSTLAWAQHPAAKRWIVFVDADNAAAFSFFSAIGWSQQGIDDGMHRFSFEL